MAKIRGNPQVIALSHPTRALLYRTLCDVEELETVSLEKKVGVTRYHLYHHLRQLAKIGLVENHRDVGRAKWWRKCGEANPIALTYQASPTSAASLSSTTMAASAASIGPKPSWADSLPPEMITLLEQGGEVRFVPLDGTANDTVNSKELLKSVANKYGIDLDLPFTFVPGGILLISQTR
ncbi:MAG: helix-turn-helix domain-containing protein [Candidatus Poseidoniaceae archaeon]|jgi:hypothetical protein|nr:helix-turn-helix domain-containing protein [Candidatus Poseidoniaceae archaeon]